MKQRSRMRFLFLPLLFLVGACSDDKSASLQRVCSLTAADGTVITEACSESQFLVQPAATTAYTLTCKIPAGLKQPEGVQSSSSTLQTAALKSSKVVYQAGDAELPSLSWDCNSHFCPQTVGSPSSQPAAENPFCDVVTQNIQIAVGTDGKTVASEGTKTQMTGTKPPLSVTVLVGNYVSDTLPFAVDFNANVIGGTAPYTYEWLSGAGGRSTEATAHFNFANPGTYQVSVNVTDSQGAAGAANTTITAERGRFLMATDVNNNAAWVNRFARILVNFMRVSEPHDYTIAAQFHRLSHGCGWNCRDPLEPFDTERSGSSATFRYFSDASNQDTFDDYLDVTALVTFPNQPEYLRPTRMNRSDYCRQWADSDSYGDCIDNEPFAGVTVPAKIDMIRLEALSCNDNRSSCGQMGALQRVGGIRCPSVNAPALCVATYHARIDFDHRNHHSVAQNRKYVVSMNPTPAARIAYSYPCGCDYNSSDSSCEYKCTETAPFCDGGVCSRIKGAYVLEVQTPSRIIEAWQQDNPAPDGAGH